MFLPISAPAEGAVEDGWGTNWLQVRQKLGISDLKQYPLMPAPGTDLCATQRALTTAEAKKWLRMLLGPERISETDRLTSHSCKATCLSFMAKRGVSLEDRLVLGYHSNKLRVGLVYSRGSAARYLALLANVLKEIREGVFEPDNTRSGRLKETALTLDQLNLISSSNLSGVEASQENEPVQNPGETEADGHATTETDETDDESCFVSPVVGHYELLIPQDKSILWNKATKMFHLAEKHHTNVLLCGRARSGNMTAHLGPIRFDSAKRKQCFRQLQHEGRSSAE